MKCEEKAAFPTLDVAKARLKKVNDQINATNKKGKRLRSYKCADCGYFHFTSMTKRTYKVFCTPHGRTQLFVKKESEYWTQKLGLTDF
jgi:uncharacterized Zn finger protein (UPF0148 family)